MYSIIFVFDNYQVGTVEIKIEGSSESLNNVGCNVNEVFHDIPRVGTRVASFIFDYSPH